MALCPPTACALFRTEVDISLSQNMRDILLLLVSKSNQWQIAVLKGFLLQFYLDILKCSIFSSILYVKALDNERKLLVLSKYACFC